MQQSAVTDYFKVKKRTRDDHLGIKKSTKLVAISEAGRDSPTRLSAASSASSPEISPAKFFSPSRQKNIFSSPVKLNEIKSPQKSSPGPAVKFAVKRLFSSDSGSASESFGGLKPSKQPAYER